MPPCHFQRLAQQTAKGAVQDTFLGRSTIRSSLYELSSFCCFWPSGPPSPLRSPDERAFARSNAELSTSPFLTYGFSGKTTHRPLLLCCAQSCTRMDQERLSKGTMSFPDRRKALRALKAIEIELLSIEHYFRTTAGANDASPNLTTELLARRDRLIRYSQALCHCSIYSGRNRG